MESHHIIVTTPLELKAIVVDAVTAVLKYQHPNHPTAESDSDDWVGIEQAADILRLAKPTVYANRRKIPHSKKHGQLYFKPSELREYIASGKQKTLKELEMEAESEIKPFARADYAENSRKKRANSGLMAPQKSRR